MRRGAAPGRGACRSSCRSRTACGLSSAVMPGREQQRRASRPSRHGRGGPSWCRCSWPLSSGLLRNASCCFAFMSPYGIVHRCSPVFMSIAVMRPSGPLKRSGMPASGSSAGGFGAGGGPSPTARDGPRRDRLAGHPRRIPLLRRREHHRRAAADRRDEHDAGRRIGRGRADDVGAAVAARAGVRRALPFRVAAMRRRRRTAAPAGRGLCARSSASLRISGVKSIRSSSRRPCRSNGAGLVGCALRRRQLLARHLRLRRGPLDDRPDRFARLAVERIHVGLLRHLEQAGNPAPTDVDVQQDGAVGLS